MSQEVRERIINVLKILDIPYSEKTRNAINIDCPYCDDPEQHCGVFVDGKHNFSCWKCKTGGSLFDLLVELAQISWADYIKLMSGEGPPTGESTMDQIDDILNKEEVEEFARDIQWPPEGTLDILKMQDDPLVMQFMESRDLYFQDCADYGVRIGVGGRYVNRFIIPVTSGGEIVVFQARDMTGRSEAKYLTEGDVSYFLYGFDNIDPHKPVSITEGIFDSWSIHHNSVSSFSTSLSDEQINLMRLADPPFWFLVWDVGEDGSDAFWKARKVQQQLQGLFGSEKVVLVELPTGEDPDSLGYDKMQEILKKAEAKNE